jgi:crotonobetainyl-CoA:carnitine CoA-transferase CaiB-like acyl-CoA transferase
VTDPATSPAATAPLAGVRVLDFSRVLAGPFCTLQLADLGAEVIKLENPDGGDDTRQFKPPEAGGEAHYYLAMNRSKRSVALDIRKPEAQEIVHGLAAKCDVLIQNYRVGVMERVGFGWETMRERHPHLIYCSISAYGVTSPWAKRPGFDPVLQAESGIMSYTGHPEGPPTRHPLAIIDTFTAMYATSAILAAYIARLRTGKGQFIDLALMDTAVAVQTNAAQSYLVSGQDPVRMGNSHPAAVPVGLFETQTGPFYMAVGTQKLFALVCEKVLERPDLLTDPRFATNSARQANRDAVFGLLNETFAANTREYWLDRMVAAGVPAGAVRSVSEAMESPEVAARGMVTTVDHPTAGPLRLLGSPYHFSDTPTATPEAPPLLGQHTEQVLRDLLGADDAMLGRWRTGGAIP